MIFKYINDPKTPANLVMVYFEQPDDAAHKYGTNSKQVNHSKFLIKLNEYNLTQVLKFFRSRKKSLMWIR